MTRRYVFLLACIVGGLISAYFAQPYVNDSSDVVTIIITVVTVFAGFLIAIIAVTGDPVLIPDGSWRIAEGGRNRMHQRLILDLTLFIFYLLTIALLFVGVIVGKALPAGDPWRIWIERAYIFCGATSFLLTFALPFYLFKQQRERYDAEIERRREAAKSVVSDDKPSKRS
jgi:hypothetical protein